MIIYLSPAKTMKRTSFTSASLLFDNSEIIKQLQSMTKEELKHMYKASDKIVDTVSHSLENPFPHYTYAGEAFKSLELETLPTIDDNLVYVGSAYYGLTKLTTGLDFHRLDFTNSLLHFQRSLYSFWKPQVVDYLLSLNQPILNLASQEYFKLIDDERLTVIDVVFLDNDKVVSAHAKKARGLYTRSFLENPSNYRNIQVLDYSLDNSDPKKLIYFR